MLNPIFNAIQGDSAWEQLITATLSVESRPQAELKAQRAEIERQQGVLSDFDSTLSKLYSTLETFTDPLSDTFEARTVSVSDDAPFTVSTGSETDLGSHTLQVERLARADTRISNQLTAAGTSLRGFFDASGPQSFSIDVASPTDADPNHRESITVTVDPTGSTDAEILEEIADAIDAAMSGAVSDGLINADARSYASVVRETTDTARLSIRSGQTGFDHRLAFSDSADGLLGLLGVNADAVATGTSGGQVTAVGTNQTDSLLNSKVVLDGLTLYRSSNQITDALDDTTISLQATGEASYDFSVKTDADAITEQVETFIKQYNDVLSYIQGKAAIDGAAGTRGDFAGDTAFTGLRFAMRNDVVQPVDGQPDGAPVYLMDLGITLNNDGTLELSNSDALLAAIQDDPAAVQRLFAGEDGLATRLARRIETYVGTNGTLDRRADILTNRLSRLDDEIAAWDDKLAQRENQLREQYARVQETISMLQSQQSAFMAYFGG